MAQGFIRQQYLSPIYIYIYIYTYEWSKYIRIFTGYQLTLDFTKLFDSFALTSASSSHFPDSFTIPCPKLRTLSSLRTFSFHTCLTSAIAADLGAPSRGGAYKVCFFLWPGRACCTDIGIFDGSGSGPSPNKHKARELFLKQKEMEKWLELRIEISRNFPWKFRGWIFPFWNSWCFLTEIPFLPQVVNGHLRVARLACFPWEVRQFFPQFGADWLAKNGVVSWL